MEVDEAQASSACQPEHDGERKQAQRQTSQKSTTVQWSKDKIKVNPFF